MAGDSVSADLQGSGYETVDRIRRSHLSARPNPSANPAWANCHMNCGVLLAQIERLTEALELFYDKWENGTPCFEDGDDSSGFVGNALKLSDSEEREILALIPKYCSKEAPGG